MSVPIKTFACSLILVLLTSCVDIFHGSTEDPLPMPSEIETNKDRSVKPGDSFFDYCNGSWLKSHPIPASGSIGGLDDADGVMNQRVDELKKSVPDIGRFYELMDHPFEHPDKAQAYFDAMKARYPKPATKEEAYTTMGKMMADGIELWSTLLMPTFNLIWKHPPADEYERHPGRDGSGRDGTRDRHQGRQLRDGPHHPGHGAGPVVVRQPTHV